MWLLPNVVNKAILGLLPALTPAVAVLDVEAGSTSFKPKLTKMSSAVMLGEKLDWLEYELVEVLL